MAGLKQVEKLIDRYGVNAYADNSPFIRKKRYVQADAMQRGLPFCFFQKIEQLTGGEAVWCYTAQLPEKKQKLAAYLVNEKKQIIEQVYYPRDHRGVRSCEKIKHLLAKSLLSYQDDKYELAA